MSGSNGSLATMSLAEKRHAARQLAREDGSLTGGLLGERFGMGARWGRQQIAAARSGTPTAQDNGTKPEPSSPNGTAERSAPPERHDSKTPVSPWPRRIATAAVIAVAAVAATSSFAHQMELAEMAGEEWRAALWPISIDGMVVASSMVLLSRRRAGEPAGALTWLALLAGVGASLAANVAAAEPTLLGRAVAGWSPLALLLSFEMLLRIRSTKRPAS